jgi:hypothetical protein
MPEWLGPILKVLEGVEPARSARDHLDELIALLSNPDFRAFVVTVASLSAPRNLAAFVGPADRLERASVLAVADAFALGFRSDAA